MSNEVSAVKEKNITDEVLSKIKIFQDSNAIKLPPNYSPENALKSAWLILQDVKTVDKKPVLGACTRSSIANALLNMVTKGLNPAKKQCYFIPYGNNLNLSVSYMGNVAMAKTYSNVKDVRANVIYEKDEFEYEFDIETGSNKIKKHISKLENIDVSKIKGAYAILFLENGLKYIEIMNMEQIKKAWSKSSNTKNSVHTDFADEMAKKTVISRACKMFINTSNDAVLFDDDSNEKNVLDEIEENANQDEAIVINNIPSEPEQTKEALIEDDDEDPIALNAQEQQEFVPTF